MRVTTVAPGVHVVTATNVNLAVVEDGSDVTLVDTGYPNDTRAVLAALAGLGHQPGDITAVVLTHAHLDHVGGVPGLRRRARFPVLTGAEEARHARREYLDQVGPVQLLRQTARPGGARWVAQTLRAVLPHVDVTVPDAQAVEPGVPVDSPGGLVAVPTPGHTPGHTAWLLPGHGVLFSGDTLVTGHPLSRARTGPQLLPEVFASRRPEVLAAARSLRDVPADVLVPGHGPALQAPVAELVDRLAG